MTFEEFTKLYKKDPLKYFEERALAEFYNATGAPERAHPTDVLLAIELIRALKK